MPSPFDMFDRHDREDAPVAHDSDQKPDTVTLTRAEFDAMIEAQNSERKRSEEMWKHMLQTPGIPSGTPVQLPTEAQFEVDLNGLPDPRTDLDGYHKGLGERLGKTYKDMAKNALDEAARSRDAGNQQANLMDTAWKKLADSNEELAAHPEIVEIAASKYFGGLRQQGLDPMRALSLDMDGVIKEVANQGMTIINGIRGQNEVDENTDGGRTRMLSGNGTSRGRATAKARVDEAQPSDFVDALKKLQREQRLY